jgi:hypothetical protein
MTGHVEEPSPQPSPWQGEGEGLNMKPRQKEPPELAIPALRKRLPAMIKTDKNPAAHIDHTRIQRQFKIKLKQFVQGF